MRYIKDLGMKYPREASRRKSRYGLYRCEQCGTDFETIILNAEKVEVIKCKSCSQKTHGQKGTQLYKHWEYMKSRCNNPNTANYKFYGGKGITVCNEWDNDFMLFKEWSEANGYIEGLTIDRIDPNKNYEPSNCQWITLHENIKRSTSSRMKPIAKFDKDGTHIENYESVTKASEITGIAKPNLFSALNGRYKTTGGFIWKWVLDNKDK